ncbi:MAG: peptidase S8 [Chloroflexi bacterium]|nr:MAG: peptidase S8 [Chloroflexota bacterium]
MREGTDMFTLPSLHKARLSRKMEEEMKSHRKFVFVLLALLVLAFSLATDSQPASADAGGLQTNKLDPALLAAIRANPNGVFRVIVRAVASDSKHLSKHSNDDRTRGLEERVKNSHGMNVHGLPLIGGAAAKLPAAAIAVLSRDPFVSDIVLDRHMQGMGNPAAALQSIYAQLVRAPDVWAQGNTGQGVGVAVVDSGVLPVDDLQLPNSRLVATVDIVSGGTTPSDPGGHGTHVAGIVGGNGTATAGAWKGIAPSANIINVRVIDGNGNTNLSTVVRGIQWVVANRRAYNIKVMNLSLGGASTQSYRTDPLDSAVEMAWASGIFVVVAAGNSGPLPTTIASPGNDPFVVTVGALDDNGTLTTLDDTIAPFSSHGPNLDTNRTSLHPVGASCRPARPAVFWIPCSRIASPTCSISGCRARPWQRRSWRARLP